MEEKSSALPLARHLATAQVHFDFSEGVFVLRLGKRLGPPQYCLYPGQQFADGKRLGDVVIGAQLKADDFVHFLPTRREHDDRNRRPLAFKLLADVEPAHAWHHDVEDHEVGRFARWLAPGR